MKMIIPALAGAALLLAGTALAHKGVENPAVQARMMLMERIGTATGTLARMLKGETPFDAQAAEAARLALIEAAGRTAPAFTDAEGDPKSEASPALWQDWTGFLERVQGFETAARGLNADSPEALRASFVPLARSCRSCHGDYRIDK